MLKLFAFSGCYCNPNSTTNFAVEELCRILEKSINQPIEKYFKSAADLKIEFNPGTGIDFSEGRTAVDDDMKYIEEKILSSSIVVFASPVYLHQVSGTMKNFIDRIAYWAHLIKLSGKIGIIISVSDSNGNKPVSDYLRQTMEHLGISIVSNISLKSGVQSREAIKSILRYEATKVKKILLEEQFPISRLQEDKFRVHKELYSKANNNVVISSERDYWKEQGMLDFPDFRTFFEHKWYENK
ncbi:NAD(P)H-dependent oxidoreductase [uncultured Vagococcus sp.]|uniref:flavodoxin family protein n=1 Tax=uncultured Vagococcus sp. TaxID=189676 RepID=UPI0028D7EBD1|nr:NAD(P)H-dependent oxidoreductase [uncultured Vagococcus sp.]